MIRISKVEWLSDYRLRFSFTDSSVGEFDFSELLAEQGPIIEPLRDVEFFRQVQLEDGAPTWPNGFDVAPGWLYREIAQAGQLTRPAVA